MRRFLAFIVLIPLLGLGCKTPVPKEASQPIRLTMWGVFDDSSAYSGLIDDYKALHANISVEYRKFRIEEYERELINAFAEDRGPDIFMIHNTSVEEWLPKITPLPQQITLPVWRTEGTVKKETVIELVTKKSVTPIDPGPAKNSSYASALRRIFPDVVTRDVIIPTLIDEQTGTKADRIYGIPTSVDTLVLFYNKDLLAAAGISEPPQDWNTFAENVQKITRLSSEGNILQSGAAIGTAENVDRATDVLALLMMQSGAQMTDEFGRAAFNLRPQGASKEAHPGVAAVRFYTDFAKPSRTTYTWNQSMSNSLEAFATGKTAMMLGYNYHLPLVVARAPKLNFDIANVPQLQSDARLHISHANYWLNTVAKKSRNPDAAWDFIQFIASVEHNPKYLAATGKPPALNSLAMKPTEDPFLPTWNSQLLTARSWYRGKNVKAAEEALKGLVNAYLAGGYEKPEDPLNDAAAKISQTVR